MTDISITAANVVAAATARRTSGKAGETITAGQALYYDSAAGTWKKADSNSATAAARAATGIALNGASTGQPLAVLEEGDVTIGATLTAGVPYYLSDTPGGICPYADIGSGEYVCLIGIAKSTTVLSVKFHAVNVAL